MGDNTKKIMTVSFVLAGALVYIIMAMLLTTFAATFAIVARAIQYDVVRHGIPVVSGLVTFGCLQFNRKITTWAEEVVVEIKKVVWPTRQQTVALTVVVTIIILISGALLGGFDLISGQGVNAGIGALENLIR